MYAILENAKLQRQHKLVVKGWEVEGLIGRTQSIFQAVKNAVYDAIIIYQLPNPIKYTSKANP